MIPILRKVVNYLHERYYTKQIEAFFSWARINSLAETEIVHVHLPRLEYRVTIARAVPQSENDTPAFIICDKSTRAEVFTEYLINDWQTIFSSPALEIWEDTSRFHNEVLPLRFGLAETEKNFLLDLTRNQIESHLKRTSLSHTKNDLINKKYLKQLIGGIDVALWVDGSLRGSQIVFDQPLIEAVSLAAKRAATQDKRFKPLTIEELPRTTIQITLMSDLTIPLMKKEFVNNEVYAEKGYLTKAGDKTGYFLPAVANCLKLNPLDKFILRLVNEKLNQVDLTKIKDIFIYEVDDFIESPSKKSLPLIGPVVATGDTFTKEFLINSLVNESLNFLEKWQKPNGNLIARFNPVSGVKDEIDWTRLSYTVWSLAKIARVTENEKAKAIASRAANFLDINLLTFPQPEVLRCSALLTHLQALIELDQLEKMSLYEEYLLKHLPSFSYDSILYAQYAHLLLHEPNPEPKNILLAKSLIDKIWTDFNNRLAKNIPFELAGFPELIPLLKYLSVVLDNSDYLKGHIDVLDWYLKQQLPDGSFPSQPKKTFSYTRGTSKIFEVLVQYPEFSETARLKTLAWLYNMQYRKENTFFVPKENRGLIYGGFRHDNFEPSVWIDANAHVLVATSRILNK